MSNQSNKTRDLSVHQLFEALQEEYIICELRVKIFALQNHKDYWQDLAKKKKEKIQDIAKRNLLPCIFDDKRIKQDYEKKIIPEVGFPNFKYKDEALLSDKARRWDQKKWDKINYYMPSSEIKIIEEGEIYIGKIKEVDFDDNTALIELRSGEEKYYELNVITRIL